ncbi:MAG: DUF2236 domain-containing protein, partial [Pseudomonadales bacterium]|nr:DUF2236 domain-containing protein [Pseudomonadales bacterium]
ITGGFDVSACALLATNTVVILYGLHWSDAIPASPALESWFWHTNVLCWGLVIWCMSGRVVKKRDVGYALDWRGVERMDPPADELVAEIYDAAGGVEDANALMHQLMAARDLSDIEATHPRLGRFARTIATQDAGFNARRVARGQAVFLKHVPINVAALCVASLPEAYVMERSGAVLGRTRRLRYPQAVRRVIETAQFVLHVVEEGGLDPCQPSGGRLGRGRIAILRVRLMHAAIRYLLRNPRPARPDDPDDAQLYEVDPVRGAWTHDGATYDWAPINQLEMLYTLHCFCWVTLRAMRQTGMSVSQQDAEDYVYFWNVVGRLMGIEPSLLPATPDEAERSFEVIKAAGRGASADGKALTKSAMRVMARMIREKTPLGRWDMRITRAYMEDFLDDATLEDLGLRVVPLWSNLAPLLFVRLLNAFMGVMDWLGEPFPPLQRVNALIGVRVLGYYTKHQSDQGLAFDLPESLKRRAR